MSNSTTSQYQIEGATPAQQREMDAMFTKFNVSDERLGEIIKEFRARIHTGLEQNGQQFKLIPAYITKRPMGNEKGSFFAIDLGGSNLRVVHVTLHGGGKFDIEHQKYSLPGNIKSGPLFDFVAEKVGTFIDDRNLMPNKGEPAIPMGFTFSYPIIQTSLTEGTLAHWTKGITAPGCVGRDVVRLLHDALLRKHIRVEIVAMLNDTVATLLATSYMHPGAQLGAILGTGTNTAYYESVEQLPKWQRATGETSGEMILNIEWGAFDSEYSVLPATMHDIKLNRKSYNPGEQGFEKMISGMYLGEIVRNALLHIIDQRLMLGGRSSEILNEMWSVDTMYLTEAINDTSSELDDVKSIIEKTLGVENSSLVDRRIFRALAMMVGNRAARLAAIGFISVLKQRPELMTETLTIGIDGSLYEYFPKFEELLYDTMRKFLSDTEFANVKLVLTKDGSCVGSAIASMLYSGHVSNK